jgi:hypothetical protein
LPVCGKACSLRQVEAWPNRGRAAVKLRSSYGQVAVKLRPRCGQAVAKAQATAVEQWPNRGPLAANGGQTAVKPWSNRGQSRGQGGGARGQAAQPCAWSNRGRERVVKKVVGAVVKPPNRGQQVVKWGALVVKFATKATSADWPSGQSQKKWPKPAKVRSKVVENGHESSTLPRRFGPCRPPPPCTRVPKTQYLAAAQAAYKHALKRMLGYALKRIVCAQTQY